MSEQPRLVFCFDWLGKRRWVDPLQLERRLDRLLGGDPAGNAEALQSTEDGIAEAAYLTLARAVCTAFAIGEPFNPETGQGLLASEWEPLLRAFTSWLAAKKAQAAS